MMIRVVSRLIGKGIDDENIQMVEPFQGTTVSEAATQMVKLLFNHLQLGCGTRIASSERQSYIYPRSGFWSGHRQEAVFNSDSIQTDSWLY